jgi:rod shape determining protein RodA
MWKSCLKNPERTMEILPRLKAFLKENLWALMTLFALVSVNIINQLNMGNPGGTFWKNLIWQVFGLLIFLILTLYFDYRRISIELIWILYGLMLLLLMILALFKKRWLVLGPVSFQPSEFLKIILVYLLALIMEKKKDFRFDNGEAFFLLAVIALPLMFLMPVDLDYAFIIGLMFLSLLLALGFPKRLFIGLSLLAILLMVVAVPVAWNKLKPHQKGRIYGYLDPERYYKTWGYQLNQSLIAIGSGGISGQGFQKGWSTRLNYLPAKNTDLAFSVWAEAFGLLGNTLFLFLYGYLLFWGLSLSRRAKDYLGKSLSLGIVIVFFWQAFFNIGGATGLLPMTSIPQPFLSYGGSITISTYLMLSILFNIAFKRYFFK